MVANPLVEDIGPFGLDSAAIIAQDVGPLQGPEIGVFGAFQECVHQPGSLVGAFVVQEGEDFARRRQNAADVEVNASNEHMVRCQTGRYETEPLHLSEEVCVHKVKPPPTLRGRYNAHRWQRHRLQTW